MTPEPAGRGGAPTDASVDPPVDPPVEAPVDAPVDVAAVFRAEHGRAVAVLTRVLGDLDRAQDAVADAFATAVARWPVDGPPPNPAGWIITTARNRALDRLRRDAVGATKLAQAARLDPTLTPDGVENGLDLDLEEDTVRDDQLRLLFTCCHPALSIEARVALTLRMLGGLSTAEIARAFLVTETTMAQRISRAKNKIAKARIPYRVPTGAELPARVGGVLAVVYLVFTEGHTASAGPDLVRAELCAEALRLARLLAVLMPDEPEVLGLLALLLLTDARRATRTDPDGRLVRLADQDRARWDRSAIAEGHDLVRACLRRNRPGTYQLQAAIQAVHADAPTAADTDWPQILALYDQLLARTASPVVALHRAVAVAQVHGPAGALRLVDELDLPRYHLRDAVRGDLLARLDRPGEAAAAFRAAAAATANPAERALLIERATAADAVMSP